jgi:hypothetical protein
VGLCVGEGNQGFAGRMAYLVGCIDGREGALEAAHLLTADVGVAVKAAHQVVVAVLDSGQLVVFGSKQVGIVAEESALAGEEVVIGRVGGNVKVASVTAGLALA